MSKSVLKQIAAKMPAAWKFRAVRLRWRLAKEDVLVEAGARVDWTSRLGSRVVVASGASVLGTTVGRHTYFGENSLVIHSSIGSFCSIAPQVIIGGGTHPSRDWVSTSPVFYSRRHNPRLAGVDIESFTENMPTFIGDDVWLGYASIILPGVKVGTGAIVAAGAVVTRDVAPYEIVAGVPARAVRARFTEDEINWLLNECRWWQWDEELLEKMTPHFHNVQSLREECERQGVFAKGTANQGVKDSLLLARA
jgi:acetyltransferase-like isoleucine patch superfamily enzyme